MSDVDGKLIQWEELSDDEMDLFKNPHCHNERVAEARDGLRTPANGTFLARTRAVIAKLTPAGKREALQVLNTATAQLDKYGRPYQKVDVGTIRGELERVLG